MKLVEFILKKVGYIPEQKARREINACHQIIDEKVRLLGAERDRKLDKLETAIRSANLVKVAYEAPNYAVMLNDAELSYEPAGRYIDPPTPDWYAITVRLDAGMLQRVYDDAGLQRNSTELDYLLQGIYRNIERDIVALMRLRR